MNESEANSKLRILLLEDDAAAARLCIDELQKGGIAAHVDVVEDEAGFRRKLEDHYDVVLADCRLPNWSGLDALRLPKKIGRDIPFILLTATLSDGSAIECLKEGATDYVLKHQLSRLPLTVRRAVKEAASRRLRLESLENLRRSEERYRLLFENNPQPMWVYDIQTLQFIAVNRAAITHYGYSRAEFLSMTLKEIRPPEDVPRLLESICVGSQKIEKAGVWRHITKSGRIIYVDISECHLEFEGKSAAFVMAHDVTDTVNAEAALKVREAEYRSIIDGAPYGIYRVNAQGKLLMVNPALFQMLGYKNKEELLAVNTADVYWDAAERQRSRSQWSANGTVTAYETKWKDRNGKPIVVRQAGRLIAGESASTLIYEVFVENVTERHQLEQQLQQAQRMEAVGRLAGGVAHDFSNLLMIISSYADLIPRAVEDSARISRYVEQITTATSRAAAVTRQLLAFGRKQILEPHVVDLNSLVGGFAKLLPRLLGEDIEITVLPAPKLDKVKVDPGQFEQVLMNLVINARDAMPSGGRLTIETNNVELEESSSRIHGTRIPNGKYVMVAVSDNGIGMDGATRERVFEPFFTTKGQGKGTGLGLSTVYGIIKQSQGFIWLYSELGRGTTFKVYLPRVDGLAEPIPVTPALIEPATRDSATILLVEDEKSLRDATAEFLQGKGFNVLTAGEGTTALALCRAYEDTIDLLVTDVVLPGIGGPELAAAAMELRPGLKVIYVSGYTERTLDKMIGPSTVFLQKPFSLRILAAKIRELLST